MTSSRWPHWWWSAGEGPRRINPIRQQQMRERAHEIEEEVARLEAEAAELQSSLQHTAGYSQTQERLQRLMQCNEQIEALYREWEELQAVL